jgi:hypothetical protein
MPKALRLFFQKSLRDTPCAFITFLPRSTAFTANAISTAASERYATSMATERLRSAENLHPNQTLSAEVVMMAAIPRPNAASPISG